MKKTLLSALFLAGATCHAAAPIDGWYSSAFGGYTYTPGNINIVQNGVLYNQATYRSGYDVGGNFGYKSNPMRYEAEVFYLRNSIKSAFVNNIQQTTIDGYNNAVFGMANVYYDFQGLIECLQPYLGAGIGYGWVNTRFHSGPLFETGFGADNSVFAFQALTGITYNFADNYAVGLGYHYLVTTNASNFGQSLQANIINITATYRFDGSNYT